MKPKLQALRDKNSTLQGAQMNPAEKDRVRYLIARQSWPLATQPATDCGLPLRSTLYLSVFAVARRPTRRPIPIPYCHLGPQRKGRSVKGRPLSHRISPLRNRRGPDRTKRAKARGLHPSNRHNPQRMPRTQTRWRSGRDSNPRYAFDVYSLSRRAPSTTRPPLRMSWKGARSRSASGLQVIA